MDPTSGAASGTNGTNLPDASMAPLTQAVPQTVPDATFFGLGLAPLFLEELDRRKFIRPTPIQEKAIPVALQGNDVIGVAQTGTGKTMAFGLPMLQRLHQNGGRGLVLAPTRELAYQIEETLAMFGHLVGIKSAVFVGGASMHLQKQSLKQNPRILVATPGRLNDHLQQRTITLKEVSVLVLDEADRMLDMGFLPQIERILKHVPAERQTMLFSATMPGGIVGLATKHMKLPLRIEVAPQGTTAERVDQELLIVHRDDKGPLLQALLEEIHGTVLVFTRTKYGAKKMTRQLRAANHSAAELHADRSLSQRREALEGFKSGKYRVLIATDIAARGIDVTGIELVVNFDLPATPEDYVHRIGRTGRAGREGKAISFALPEQRDEIRAIERLIQSPLKQTHVPHFAPDGTEVPHPQEAPRSHARPSHSRGPRRSGGGGGGRREGSRRRFGGR